jgi:hypothetical protein
MLLISTLRALYRFVMGLPLVLWMERHKRNGANRYAPVRAGVYISGALTGGTVNEVSYPRQTSLVIWTFFDRVL